MKIGLIHLSDFHIRENEKFLPEKITKFLDSLNVLDDVDEYVVVFSGDLAHSGKINEYTKAGYIIRQIIYGIKQKQNNKFVELLMVPGNHDLTLTPNSRTGAEIQKAYDNNSIENQLDYEIELFDNYYTHLPLNARVPYDRILDRRFCNYKDDYKIQFNLINTALFSTLKPDDKELHYFPKEKMESLKKQNEANVCITIMHHSYEWFNWKYQSDLEKVIINNSELLFIGHDHSEKTKKVSIDDSMDTWVSCAGEMKFSDISYQDSFNIILIDTNNNTFSGYIFNWEPNEKIYNHKKVVDNKPLQNRTNQLIPLSSYIKEIKEDSYHNADDFTKYFVFPELISEKKNDFGKINKILNIEEFLDFIETQKRILISGITESGKSVLLKYLYCSIFKLKTPLFLSIDSTTKINPKKFIKRLFEDQYGDDPITFEKYQQLEKDSKILIIDGWERLNHNSKNHEYLIQIIEENFNHIVISANKTQDDIIEFVKSEINKERAFHELRVKPFFIEKRNQLVRNICMLNSLYNDEDIDQINKLIDRLVQHNNSLFSLNPAFIIRYTEYLIKNHSYDYTQGEVVFSKVFEHKIQSSIIAISKKSDVDEIITAFEELAGYINSSRNDLLKIDEFCKIIEKYNEEYRLKISADNVLEIGIRAKVLKKTEDLSIHFSDKNYLAYFIAKYLLRLFHSENADYSGIEYALKNICFGINADIILFISYLSSNTKIVMSISEQAGMLLLPWEELNFEENNISFMKYSKQKQIKSPTDEDYKKFKTEKEHIEENNYSEETIEAIGLYEYNENDIDKYPFRLIRAIKYTEMLCKSLPAFNNVLKGYQKENLIESIYSYPHKVAFALLKPIDTNIDIICEELLEFAREVGNEKKSGKAYTKDDIIEMINSYSIAVVLSTYDYFAELCTNSKTVTLLSEKDVTGVNQWLEKLIIKENSGNTDIFLKEAENIIKNYKNEQIDYMVKLIVRKHLLCSPKLPRNKKQQIIDKFFGKDSKATMLLTHIKQP